MINAQEKTASISAINAYVVLVLAFVGLKTAFSKEVIDFLPILLSVLLLILNNSVKYYNRIPSILALLITIGLSYFLFSGLQPVWEVGFANTDVEWYEIARLGIMAIISLVPIPYFLILIKEKEI